jgi:hypothetical protein
MHAWWLVSEPVGTAAWVARQTSLTVIAAGAVIGWLGQLHGVPVIRRLHPYSLAVWWAIFTGVAAARVDPATDVPMGAAFLASSLVAVALETELRPWR